MIFTEEVFELEDKLDALLATLIQSETLSKHCQNKAALIKNVASCEKERAFIEAKDRFEQVAAYGEYAPEFKTRRRELRQKKRELDLDERVMEFRLTEHDLQSMLDRIVYEMAQVVSPTIKVDAGNPFFEFATKGCGGNCHG